MKDLAGKYVKNEYYLEQNKPERSVDVEIAIKLKKKIKHLELKSTNIVILTVGEPTSQFFIIPLIHGL